jgi:hypothetical protein
MTIVLAIVFVAALAAAAVWFFRRAERREDESTLRYGYLDKSGTEIIPPRFEAAQGFSGGLAAVKLEGLWGYIDPAGALVIPPYFGEAQPFSEDAAAVRVGSGVDGADWGYIDREGRWLVEPRFACAGPFRGGFARVTLAPTPVDAPAADRHAYIDRSGATVLTDPFPSEGLDPHHFHAEGRFPVALDGGAFGFLDRGGKLVGGRCAAVRAFSGGLAAAAQEAGPGEGGSPLRWGYLDTAGNWAVAPRYDHAGDFQGGLALVGFDGESIGEAAGHFLLRADGRPLPGGPFRAADASGDGPAAVEDAEGRLRWIDRDGATVLEPGDGLRLAAAAAFHEGLARVELLPMPIQVELGSPVPGDLPGGGGFLPPPQLEHFIDLQCRIAFTVDRVRCRHLQDAFSGGRLWFARVPD